MRSYAPTDGSDYNRSYATIFEYDNFGRTTRIIHPSRGETWYFYDGATNRVALEQNPLGDISYHYDELGRLIRKKYSLDFYNDVSYEYGAADHPIPLQRGRLIRKEDATGITEFEYGNMGEITAKNRMHILPLLPNGIHGEENWITHRTEWTYDSWGRTRTITYPDGEVVHYEYCTAGLLRRVTGNQEYVVVIYYNKNGQKTEVHYGNGIVAIYIYDPVMWRLTEHKLIDGNNTVLMHKKYWYDNVGNVVQQEDFYNFADDYQDWEYRIVHFYGYDSDYRLIFAQ